MLKLTNVHKSFGKTEILKGISLNVEKGSVVAVLGPSGAGKTTLLRCMNLLEKADSGEMDFDDIHVDLKKIPKKTVYEIRKKTAFVFQNYNLFNNKTALEKVGLKDKAAFYPSSLSGGQQQRVGIARALAVNPDVILFDEPTSALDPELIDEVLGVIRQLAEEGTTMVIVTHEMAFARDIADYVVFMEDGQIIEEKSAAEFFTNPENERSRQFLKRFFLT